MKRLTIMIKPASSLCDMRCKYCFYYDVAAQRHEASMGIMPLETASAILNNVFSQLTAGDHITFAFQGGEPGLAGLDYFKFFAETAKKIAPKGVRIHYAFQTNGLMMDTDWAVFFRQHNFLIGLSMDGDAALHNQNRPDAAGKGTHSRVLASKKMLDKHSVQYNILCVLTSETARRARRVWDFIMAENIRHIQFIPCLEPLDTNQEAAPALTPAKFYQFYATLFPLWKKEAQKGNVVNIRMFEDLAGMFLAGQNITCGMSGRCSPQMVVEADGGVYPCDFYVLDEYRVADLSRQNLKDVFEAVASSNFLKEARPQPAHCAGCAYVKWCGGGCKRMARAVYSEGENCGMRAFLDECLNDLLTTVRGLR